MAERPSEPQNVEAIVEAVANIVRSSLNQSFNSPPESGNEASASSNSGPASRSTTFQRASALQPGGVSGLSQLSSSLGSGSSSAIPKKRFAAPTLFLPKRGKALVLAAERPIM